MLIWLIRYGYCTIGNDDLLMRNQLGPLRLKMLGKNFTREDQRGPVYPGKLHGKGHQIQTYRGDSWCVILYLGIVQLYHIMMEWLLDDAGCFSFVHGIRLLLLLPPREALSAMNHWKLDWHCITFRYAQDIKLLCLEFGPPSLQNWSFYNPNDNSWNKHGSSSSLVLPEWAPALVLSVDTVLWLTQDPTKGVEWFLLFFCRFWMFNFFFLVPLALYLRQFGTRTCHFAWNLHFGMVTLHFAWYLLHLAMFAFHFAWHLSHFGTSIPHLHGICYILVLQTFMWVSWGFLRLHLGCNLMFNWGFH